jgi:hypothetical protein
MTQKTFNALCAGHFILPEVALENEKIREALKAKNDLLVARLLAEEF